MSIEAMKQALEALEIEDSACRHEKEITPEHIASSITALRQAIQQAEKQEKLCKYCGGIGRVACDGRCMPKQVPVASMMVDLFNAAGIGISFEPSEVTHIYSTGASTAEKQEPVGEIRNVVWGGMAWNVSFISHKKLNLKTKLYTAPPKREWVGLTDEDFDYKTQEQKKAMKLAAAWLKERNNG